MTMTEKTEDLIADARRMAPFYDKGGTLEVARLLTRLADALEAAARERDAALAAIGRVREAVSGHPECDRYEEGDVISCGWKSAYASVVAALDGAPEPEWEWGYRGEKLIYVHARKSRESAEGAVKDLTEYLALHGKKFEVVRRRPAGPWEPVEGEKP